MGLWRYFNWRNWYSDEVELLFCRMPSEYECGKLKENHKVAVVDYENYGDSQAFEKKRYLKIYHSFLLHGDIGVFAYTDGKCAARCWGVVNPDSVSEGGIDFKLLGLKHDDIFIHYVETDKKHRREGLGRECLEKLMEICRAKKMYLLVNIDNDAAIKLYKSLGFREIGVLHNKKRLMKQELLLYHLDRNCKTNSEEKARRR